MGCDIHSYAEIKRTNRDGVAKWDAVGRVFKSAYHNKKQPPVMLAFDDTNKGVYERNEPLTLHPYDGRNYDLFAMLANVRNGYGFAGVDTGEGFKPIAEPRGVPEDASKYYQNEVAYWDGDGHSHSYFTLAELEAYDWEGQTTTHRGMVNKEQYEVFKKNGKPQSWSGGVWGGRVKNITNKEMDKLVVKEGDESSYYTQVSWQESYAASAGSFLTETLPTLRKLSKMKEVEDIRIVFFFDN